MRSLVAALVLCASTGCPPTPSGELSFYHYSSRTETCEDPPVLHVGLNHADESTRIMLDGREIAPHQICTGDATVISRFLRDGLCDPSDKESLTGYFFELDRNLDLGLHSLEAIRDSDDSRVKSEPGYFHTDRGYFGGYEGSSRIACNGIGRFLPSEDVFSWGNLHSMLVADIDGDGHDDGLPAFWITADAAPRLLTYLYDSSAELGIKVVDASATFADSPSYYFFPRALRDVDMDDCADVLVQINEEESDYREVIFARSRCDGSFDDYVYVEQDRYAGGMGIVDLIGDETREVAVYGDGEVRIYQYNSVLREFQSPVVWPSEIGSMWSRTVDLDADSQPEVIGFAGCPLGFVVGKFEDQQLKSAYSDVAGCDMLPSSLLATGDIDGDGHVDIVQGRTGWNKSVEGFDEKSLVNIYWGRGDLTFDKVALDTSALFDQGELVNGLALGDLTGDGINDIYASGVFEQVAPRVFHDETVRYGATNLHQTGEGDAVWIVDLNSDGHNDIVDPLHATLFTFLPWSEESR